MMPATSVPCPLTSVLAATLSPLTTVVEVLVTAPVGFGKSRLRHELLRRLRRQATPPEVLIGQGDSVTAGSPFAIIAQAIAPAIASAASRAATLVFMVFFPAVAG